jgi:hypothetical protein
VIEVMRDSENKEVTEGDKREERSKKIVEEENEILGVGCMVIQKGKGKGKFTPDHAMKAYRGNRGNGSTYS